MADKQDSAEGADTENPKADKAKPDSKAGEKGGKTAKRQSSSSWLFAVGIIVAIIIISAGIWLLMPPAEQGPPEDAGAVARAIEQSSGAMAAAERGNNLTILRSDGTSERNGTGYMVSFPVIGSDSYTTFDALLDGNLTLVSVGLDGRMTGPKDFISQQSGPNTLQKCAKTFNEKAVIPNMVAKWYNTTNRMRYVMTIPKSINCSGTEYPYTLELGDGYVKTTLAGNYFKNGFTNGIVKRGLKIPAEDVGKGVFVYVDVLGPYQLGYSYELRDKSMVTFDAYGGQLASDYNIKVVPTIVWNCKYANAGTKATGELNGTVQPGTEAYMLKKFACIYNNGVPQDLCSEVGVVRDASGNINSSIPTEYILTMYSTGVDSCKPDNGTVKVDVFYSPNCTDCENQRRVLNGVAEQFGGHLDLTYYCVGDKAECTKLVGARG